MTDKMLMMVCDKWAYITKSAKRYEGNIPDYVNRAYFDVVNEKFRIKVENVEPMIVEEFEAVISVPALMKILALPVIKELVNEKTETIIFRNYVDAWKVLLRWLIQEADEIIVKAEQ